MNHLTRGFKPKKKMLYRAHLDTTAEVAPWTVRGSMDKSFKLDTALNFDYNLKFNKGKEFDQNISAPFLAPYSSLSTTPKVNPRLPSGVWYFLYNLKVIICTPGKCLFLVSFWYLNSYQFLPQHSKSIPATLLHCGTLYYNFKEIHSLLVFSQVIVSKSWKCLISATFCPFIYEKLSNEPPNSIPAFLLKYKTSGYNFKEIHLQLPKHHENTCFSPPFNP